MAAAADWQRAGACDHWGATAGWQHAGFKGIGQIAHSAQDTAWAVVSMPATTTPPQCAISFSRDHSFPEQ